MLVHSSSQYPETVYQLACASLWRFLDLNKTEPFKNGSISNWDKSFCSCMVYHWAIGVCHNCIIFIFSTSKALVDISRFVVSVLYFMHCVKYVSIIYYREDCWFWMTVTLLFFLLTIVKRFILMQCILLS